VTLRACGALTAGGEKKGSVFMAKLYYSPSTQEHNLGVGDFGTEEKRMNIVADYGIPALMGAFFDLRRNKPEMTLRQVIDDSNAFGADIHVAVHSNAGGGEGTEIWYDDGNAESKKLAECIYKHLAPLSPGKDRGIKAAAGQYGELRDVKARARVIIEAGFHDNREDAYWIINQPKQVADAINQGIFDYAGIFADTKKNLTLIMGDAIATKEQAREWLKKKAPDWAFMADLYYDLAAKYGVRPDVALAQAVKETGAFKYNGIVKPWQNNFCGLGATGAAATGEEPLRNADPAKVSFKQGVHGAIFFDRTSGVEAHIQHLYAYACAEPLPLGAVLVDPRFALVKRGAAPYVEYLGAKENPAGTGWAWPGIDYGKSIVRDYLTDLLATKAPEPVQPPKPPEKFTDLGSHWAKNEILEEAGLGLIAGYSNGTFRPDDPPTRAEMVAYQRTSREYLREQLIQEIMKAVRFDGSRKF